MVNKINVVRVGLYLINTLSLSRFDHHAIAAGCTSGTGLVAAPASKKILAMAGLEDCYSTTRGHSRTTGNFITAVFNAVSASYGYLSPELWKPTVFSKAPFQEHTDFLAKEAESAKADAAY